MARKNFIERFNLTKTNTTCYFYDGRARKSRTLYINKYGNLYVFYENDLHSIRLPKNTQYEERMESIKGYLGAGYSWYK